MSIKYKKSNRKRERARKDPVSFVMITKGILGFRESARLVKLAAESGCTIRLTAGDKVGSTDSVLSLTALGLGAGNSVFLSIDGRDKITALSGCARILNENKA